MRMRKSYLFAALAIGAMAWACSTAMAGQPPPCNLANVSGTLTAPSITCLSSTGSSITLQICGTGTYGAPGGFSIQLETKADFDADFAGNPGAPVENRGWRSSLSSYRCWSLAGQCGQQNGPYHLASGGCVTLIIDQDFAIRYADNPVTSQCGASEGCGQAILSCGTEYIFRIFAHQYNDNGCPKVNLGKSDQGPLNAGSPPYTGQVCSTASCGPVGGCTFTWGYWKTHGPEGCSPGNQS